MEGHKPEIDFEGPSETYFVSVMPYIWSTLVWSHPTFEIYLEIGTRKTFQNQQWRKTYGAAMKNVPDKGRLLFRSSQQDKRFYDYEQ
jgi:hypothetical protein